MIRKILCMLGFHEYQLETMRIESKGQYPTRFMHYKECVHCKGIPKDE